MKYLQPSFTVDPPAQVTCCEACVYARGEHAEWCPFGPVQVRKLYGERVERGEIPPELCPPTHGWELRAHCRHRELERKQSAMIFESQASLNRMFRGC